MFKFVITLVFNNFILTVYAVTLYKSSIKGAVQAKRFLNDVHPDETLPIVVIQMDGGLLQSPDDIISAEVVDKKLVSGTQFSRMNFQTQKFLCPKQNPENLHEKCLVFKNFGNSEWLKCPQEPTPVVFQDPDSPPQKCGIGESGIFHQTAFSICPPDPEGQDQYVNKALPIYDFCYNAEMSKILFTSHYISSPKLLDKKLFLLHHEQKLSYPYEHDDTVPTANNDEIQSALYWESHPSHIPLRPNYKVQKLVPREDMPFGIWNKTINRNFNVELQHVDLFEFWEEINDKVREAAVQSDKKDVQFLVRTGVFNSNVNIREGRAQMYNRWIKLVIAEKRNMDNVEKSAVVFLMDNFLNIGDDINDVERQSLKAEIERFCPVYQKFCMSQFIARVENVGGQLKCCLMNSKIAQLFGVQMTSKYLKIRGLTIR